MKLKLARIESLLAPERYVLGLQTWKHDWHFVRDHPHLPIFQGVEIRFAGRRREAVAGRVWTSALRNGLRQGLCEDRLLYDIASDPQRGQSVIEERDEAKRWEHLFADSALREAESLADAEGEALATRTSEVREAVEGYRGLLPKAESTFALKAELMRRLPPEIVAAAIRLADWPGVLLLRGAEEVCESACLCVLGFEEQVEGRRGSFDLIAPSLTAVTTISRHQPISSPSEQLCWRVWFLTDWLIDHWNGLEGSGLSLSPRP